MRGTYRPVEDKEYERVKRNALRVVRKIRENSDKLSEKDRRYANELINNLENRAYENTLFGSNNQAIRERTHFISDLFDAIKDGDIDRQINMLSEEKIKPFKGRVTQRLYNLLKARQQELEDNTIELKENRAEFGTKFARG